MTDAIKIEQNRLISLARSLPLQSSDSAIWSNRIPVGTWLDWESLLQIWPLIRSRLITIAGITDANRVAEFKGILRTQSRSACMAWSYSIYGDFYAAIGLMNSERMFCYVLRNIISSQYIRGWDVRIGDTSTTFHKNDVGMLLSYISTSVMEDYFFHPVIYHDKSKRISQYNTESDAEHYGVARSKDVDFDIKLTPEQKEKLRAELEKEGIKVTMDGDKARVELEPKRNPEGDVIEYNGSVTFELDSETKKKLGYPS